VVRWIGAAFAAIGGGPVALAVGAITAAALVVRKYWQPIKAFIGGMFDGVRAAVGPALAEVAAAMAPLRPAWQSLSNVIGQAWNWIVKLVAPINMTSEQLQGAANAGRVLGAVIGAVIANGLRGFAALARVIGWVVGKAAAVSAIVSKIPAVGATAALAARAFGGGQDAQQAARDGLAAPAAGRGRVPPRVPAAAARGGRGVTDASTHTYNITQQAGESGEALAKRIEAERRRREGVARRGRLADGVD